MKIVTVVQAVSSFSPHTAVCYVLTCCINDFVGVCNVYSMLCGLNHHRRRHYSVLVSLLLQAWPMSMLLYAVCWCRWVLRWL